MEPKKKLVVNTTAMKLETAVMSVRNPNRIFCVKVGMVDRNQRELLDMEQFGILQGVAV